MPTSGPGILSYMASGWVRYDKEDSICYRGRWLHRPTYHVRLRVRSWDRSRRYALDRTSIRTRGWYQLLGSSLRACCLAIWLRLGRPGTAKKNCEEGRGSSSSLCAHRDAIRNHSCSVANFDPQWSTGMSNPVDRDCPRRCAGGH